MEYLVLCRKGVEEKQTGIYLFAPVIRANSWLSLVSHGGKPIFAMFLGEKPACCGGLESC